MYKGLAGLWKYIVGCAMLLIATNVRAQLHITPNKTAQQLAQVLSGKGITVSNPILNCSSTANATFKATNTNIGLDSGIVLTSGNAVALTGPSSLLASLNNGYSGDPDLNNLSGQNTHDACVLEFDFIPKGDSIKFDYVFSSEEYINATCGPYNDVFGFFITGNGIVGEDNIALVPGTNIPVAINSINNGIPGPGFSLQACQAMGPGSPFTQYYIDNSTGATVTHKGFTTVLQANYPVTPCSTYHLKLAIADAGNALYDSGVFLKAGSLQTNTLSAKATGAFPAPDTATFTPFIVKGCLPGSFVVTRPQPLPQSQVVNYTLAGTAISGVDYAPLSGAITILANQTSAVIPVQALQTPANSVKNLILQVLTPFACNLNDMIADTATMLIYDSMYAHIISPDTTICRFQSVPLQVVGGNGPVYAWSPAIGLDNNTSQAPIATPLETTNYLLTVSWPNSGCASIHDSIEIQILPVPFIGLDSAINVCLDGVLELNPTLDPDSAGYRYQWAGPGNFTSTALHTSVNDITEADSGMYVLTVSVNNGCPGAMDSAMVHVVSPPLPASLRSPMYFCEATVDQHLHDVGDSLMWYTERAEGIGTPLIPIDNESPLGLYVYYAANVERGCESKRTKILVHIQRCCEDKVFIPGAFTPNNDGNNDRLTFTRSDDHHVKGVKIFNRWGECVFQSTEPSPAWDGYYKGQLADVGNYYYIITMICNSGTEITQKGDVILIR